MQSIQMCQVSSASMHAFHGMINRYISKCERDQVSKSLGNFAALDSRVFNADSYSISLHMGSSGRLCQM